MQLKGDFAKEVVDEVIEQIACDALVIGHQLLHQEAVVASSIRLSSTATATPTATTASHHTARFTVVAGFLSSCSCSCSVLSDTTCSPGRAASSPRTNATR